MIRNKLVAALALLCAFLFGGGTLANSQSQSKHWYVPWPTAHLFEEVTHLTIANFSGGRARVNVRAFNATGSYLSALSSSLDVSPGQMSEFRLPGVRRDGLAYVLVISNQPVVAQARASVLIARADRRDGRYTDCQTMASEAFPSQRWVVCAGSIGRWESDGYKQDTIRTWDYLKVEERPAFPIDCANAPPDHFVCKQRHGGTVIGPGVAGGPGGVAGVGPADPTPAPTAGGDDSPTADDTAGNPPSGQGQGNPPNPPGGQGQGNPPAGQGAAANPPNPPPPGGDDGAANPPPPPVQQPEVLFNGMSNNTDRPGGDLLSFQLPDRTPRTCQSACAANPLCRAWVYIRPDFADGDKPVCRLKGAVTEKVENPCCISGLK